MCSIFQLPLLFFVLIFILCTQLSLGGVRVRKTDFEKFVGPWAVAGDCMGHPRIS
uniref:Uncharacterized protein n=1 Tax=Arundo donax TaxID=35708 RepID=A0A0A9AAM8_ARUDO